MTTANFIAMKEFSNLTNEIELGKSVTIGVREDYNIVSVLLEITKILDLD